MDGAAAEMPLAKTAATMGRRSRSIAPNVTSLSPRSAGILHRITWPISIDRPSNGSPSWRRPQNPSSHGQRADDGLGHGGKAGASYRKVVGMGESKQPRRSDPHGPAKGSRRTDRRDGWRVALSTPRWRHRLPDTSSRRKPARHRGI